LFARGGFLIVGRGASSSVRRGRLFSGGQDEDLIIRRGRPCLIGHDGSFAGQRLEKDEDGLQEVRFGGAGRERTKGNMGVRASTPADLLCPFDSCAQGTTTIRSWNAFNWGGETSRKRLRIAYTSCDGEFFVAIHPCCLAGTPTGRCIPHHVPSLLVLRPPGEEQQAEACMGGLF
jgi:hypothetical protein